jgi:bifunctional non-homologous end joining protein LigD
VGDRTGHRRTRDPRRTREPVPGGGGVATGADDGFVIQEHHSRRLHWDVRLEHDGVLVSWVVPMGLPIEPGTPRLAVHTEDHPLDYATFEGEIPAGEYGGGTMSLWDRGRYEPVHWNNHKVEVVLRGERITGRYVFVNQHSRDNERNWRVRRLDPAPAGWQPLPSFVPPMEPRHGPLPRVDEDPEWAYEFHWDGTRAIARVQGGHLTLCDAEGTDITRGYPDLRGLGEQLGSTEALLDGAILVFSDGRPDPEAVRRRESARTPARARTAAARSPAVYLLFDVLHVAGHSCLDLPYLTRRELLAGLGLDGAHWRVPEHYAGDGGAVVRASSAHGLTGVVAKRVDSPYRPGERSDDWRRIGGVDVRDVVIGGFHAGGEDTFRSLLLGIPRGDKLAYVGTVSRGFTREEHEMLARRLRRSVRKRSPFHPVPSTRGRDVRWVKPELVGEVVFRGWSKTGRLQGTRWRGLRPGARVSEVAVDG